MLGVDGWQKINLFASAVVLCAGVANVLVLTVDALRPLAEVLLLALCAVLVAAQLVAAVWLVVSAINLRKCAMIELNKDAIDNERDSHVATADDKCR